MIQIVLIKQNGYFLKYSESITHTGRKISVDWTKDINEASTFSYLNYNLRKFKEMNNLKELEVEVIRTVRVK